MTTSAPAPATARVLTLARELGEQSAVANAQHNLGLLAANLGQPEKATTLLADSLALFRHLGDRRNTAWSLNALGDALRDRGDFDRSAAMLQEGLAIFRELGDRLGIAWSLRHKGHLAIARGDPARRRRTWERLCGGSWTPGTGPASPAPWRRWCAP